LVADGIILKMKIMSDRGHHPLKLMTPTYVDIVTINRQPTFVRTKDSRYPAIDRVFLKEYTNGNDKWLITRELKKKIRTATHLIR